MNNPLSQNLDQGILRLTMTNPQTRNALSAAMIAELNEALDQAAIDKNVRVIVVGAEGNVFCSGHDLKQMTKARENDDGGLAYYQEIMTGSSNLMQKIVNHPLPVIADVRGIASAAGCQLVASCDLAIASQEAQFTTPGVNIGLFCSTPMVALTRNVSNKHAMEMLLCGDMISAERAEQIGLVNKVVPASQMDEAIDAMARNIASKSTATIQTGKAAFYAQKEMDLADAYEYATSVMSNNMMIDDAREGIGAFFEKRKPEWSDS